MQLKHCPTFDQLNEFVTGKLALDAHDVIEHHLDQCPACQGTVEILDENSATFLTGLKHADAEPGASRDPDLQQLVDRAKLLKPRTNPQGDSTLLKNWSGAQPQFASGTELGNYVVSEPIGGGNMGFVYKAYHKRMKRDVALKFISPHLIRSQEARRRFQREIEAVAKLNHPNVATAYDADEVDGYCFLVQELITGDDLREVVKRDGPLPIDRALRYVLHASRGLQYAHGVGVIHRDIKPSNLLLDEQDEARVVDFGLARLDRPIDDSPGEEVSRTGIVAGTPAYMSPEQCLDLRQTDHRTDIYSLGCTLFYLLTGRTAFQVKGGATALLARHQAPVPSILDSREDCPVEVDRLCQSMMAVAPKDRPQTMSDVADKTETLLARFQRGELTAAPKRVAWTQRRMFAALTLGAVVLAVLLLVRLGSTILQDADTRTDTGADASNEKVTNTNSKSNGTAKPNGDKPSQPAIGSPEIELVRIKSGKFSMGSPAEDSQARRDEKPRHEVEISKPFLLGKFEITTAQYTEVMQNNQEQRRLSESGAEELAAADSSRLPMSGISWLEAIEFCNRLSECHGLSPYYKIDGKAVSVQRGSDGFRLPTESEWEYACRANSVTIWHFGDDPKKLGDFAWYADNSDGLIHPVGTKKPNAFGLHDMYGNVPEWCWDRFDPDYYAESEAIDPPGSSRGEQRVFRGGGANHRASQTRSAVRNPLGSSYGFLNNVGLRVARSVE